MNTTFMNSENKTSHPYMKVLNLTDKKRCGKFVPISNLSIYYI